MNRIENAVSAELKALKPFEWLYVRKNKGGTLDASYVVTGTENGREITLFHRIVEMDTEKVLDTVYYTGMSADAAQVFDEHYHPAYVRSDGFALTYDLCVEHGRYSPGTLPIHKFYGQNVYHADVGELHLKNGDWMSML
jgi:hypothetical protein